MEWKERYPKSKKPAYDALLAFFSPRIRDLFERFDHEMRARFDVHNKHHRYSSTDGWTYGFGRSYGCVLLTVTVQSDRFFALDIPVDDEVSLAKALEKAQARYDDGFEERYADLCAKRRAIQIENTKKRMEREKAEMERTTKGVDDETLNQFRWCKKVSRSKLLALYQGEANGLLDEDLLEDIGLAFYLRCKQAKEVRQCMEKGEIVCHNCGSILKAGRVSPTGAVLKKDDHGLIVCGCGHCYTYREYRRSCNAQNMPGGRATPLFEAYLESWPACRDASQKMMLIDQLVHELHVTLMSGLGGRSVCENLIEGSKTQIGALIVRLAYGNS